jgi:hypothetical protein
MQKIHFNGKEYDSLDDMPPSERQAYEKIMSILVDKNQNGVPDIFEGDVLHNLVRTAASTVFVDGKQVSSLESLPPEKRAKYGPRLDRSTTNHGLAGCGHPPLRTDSSALVRDPGGFRRVVEYTIISGGAYYHSRPCCRGLLLAEIGFLNRGANAFILSKDLG